MSTVSSNWVLNQLAGMSFPDQGQAYDYMKKCIASAEKIEKEAKAIKDCLANDGRCCWAFTSDPSKWCPSCKANKQ